ncbi:hypothetical protein ACFY2W_10545 [Streptomyces sp. NPDC001262]|uniref:hypothetical protein n=1 Tax=Streptomyces sp. NPDC001262 TaxID=3364552 RepID=UPI00367E4133
MLNMDSGIAAIIGAAVGAAGTAVAAGVTGFWARSQAKLQLAAQRDQTDSQIRAEHARSIRDPRRACYIEFIVQTENVSEFIRAAATKLANGGSINTTEERFLDQYKRIEDPLRNALAAVSLEGPEGVWAAAASSAAKLSAACEELMSWQLTIIDGAETTESLGRVNEILGEAHSHVIDFRSAGMLVLRENGTETHVERLTLRTLPHRSDASSSSS